MDGLIRHLVNLLLWALPPTRLLSFRRFCWRLAGVEMGKGSCICGGGWIYGPGRLRVGDGTWLSPCVRIFTHREVRIDIGDRCDIGHGVDFITGSHAIGGHERRAGAGVARSIVIGEGCWIGAGARILGGVSVGSGAVIAAGAVVTRGIPPNVLAAGVPATVKKALPL